MDPNYFVRDEAGLLFLYGRGSEASLVKEINYVHPHYRAFIEASNYVILATSGADGMDASPRGAGWLCRRRRRAPCCYRIDAATIGSTPSTISSWIHGSACFSWCRVSQSRCA